MKILITGSRGYLGKTLLTCLSNEGYQIGEYNRETPIEFIQEFKPDIVIHTICSYGRNKETAKDVYTSNLISGIDILSQLETLDKKVTFINCGTSLKLETNLYSMSKGHFVEYGKYKSNNTLQFINMNLQHFYGPGATNNFITLVFEQCLKNNKMLLTEGLQKRDFIYIDDVLNVFKTVIAKKDILEDFENIDVGTGNTTQLRTVVKKIHTICKSKSKLGFGEVPMRSTEELEMKADITKLRKLGWAPLFSVDQGLDLIKEFYNERHQ